MIIIIVIIMMMMMIMTLSLNFRMLHFTILVVFRTDTCKSKTGLNKIVSMYDDNDGDDDYNNNSLYTW